MLLLVAKMGNERNKDDANLSSRHTQSKRERCERDEMSGKVFFLHRSINAFSMPKITVPFPPLLIFFHAICSLTMELCLDKQPRNGRKKGGKMETINFVGKLFLILYLAAFGCANFGLGTNKEGGKKKDKAACVCVTSSIYQSGRRQFYSLKNDRRERNCFLVKSDWLWRLRRREEEEEERKQKAKAFVLWVLFLKQRLFAAAVARSRTTRRLFRREWNCNFA